MTLVAPGSENIGTSAIEKNKNKFAINTNKIIIIFQFLMRIHCVKCKLFHVIYW